MGRAEIERIAMFEIRFEQAQATDVVDLPWGFALLQANFPLSHWHNRIVVTSDVPAAEVLAAADAVLGGACLQHRYLTVVNDDLGQALSADFAAAGYRHETIATMVYAGPKQVAVELDVRAVSFEELRPALVRDWQLMLPDVTDEQVSQLADRTTLYGRGAEVRLLTVWAGDEIAARAELYVDRVGRIAQFENLFTHPDFRCRGYGAALVRDALRRTGEAGVDLSFLTAAVDDWPYNWYRRVGYVDAGPTHHFNRGE
ncbi:MAG: GNAT family N-acetyltransferase [Ilumatobacteraceae bacterium]